jgi:hypothetical protein
MIDSVAPDDVLVVDGGAVVFGFLLRSNEAFKLFEFVLCCFQLLKSGILDVRQSFLNLLQFLTRLFLSLVPGFTDTLPRMCQCFSSLVDLSVEGIRSFMVGVLRFMQCALKHGLIFLQSFWRAIRIVFLIFFVFVLDGKYLRRNFILLFALVFLTALLSFFWGL